MKGRGSIYLITHTYFDVYTDTSYVVEFLRYTVLYFCNNDGLIPFEN